MKKILFIVLIIFTLLTCDFFKEVEKMSIDIQPTPTPGAPLTTDDYNDQNAIIQAEINDMVNNALLITEFGSLLIPQIADGVNIPHGGARYLVSGNTNISGSPTNGRVYIKLTESGDELLPSFVNSAIGFSWNYVWNGFYNASGDQLLPYILIKSGTNYYKHTLDKSENKFNIESKIIINERIDLGSWNMDTTLDKTYSLPIRFLTVYNPLLINHFTEFIINVDIKIRTDSPTANVYNITGVQATVDAFYLMNQASGNIIITRVTGGDFDNAAFSSTTISRGDIHLTYKI